MMNKFSVIGVMSGTSLDGIDIASCLFEQREDGWKYAVDFAETIDYSSYWKETLGNLENATAFDFINAHIQYGHLQGKIINDFILKYNLSPDFVATHGHTIFHQPDKKITVQIGDGAAIAAECGQTVICDFRSLDVALGGQGAPLVPIGDKLLFSEYDFCLNLGGFGNISYDVEDKRIAYDTCPVNIVMNRLAKERGKEFDTNGEIASSGKVNADLLKELNELAYYKKSYPKSLGKEWVVEQFNPVVDSYKISVEDKLCTICEHIAIQISTLTHQRFGGKMLVTGGGAKNSFLISRLNEYCNTKIIIPDKNTIDYKEAVIFAFLGLLRMTNRQNCLKSVTGASKDNIGGAVYLGK